MARESLFWSLLLLGCRFQVLIASPNTDTNPLEYMSKDEREALKEEARDMFYHAYNAYMDNAYPADELMPLSCKGRYRGSEPHRGDIDSTLGNFSLTLVDTLDTLVVLGDLEEFENAVKLIARDVTFDSDIVVSLFETNIRMLGGLLSGHILAEYLQQRADIMSWYRGELLNLAKDLGYRFLPAFNTTTGIPFGRINLKNGMKGVPIEMTRETCTACAGSMILEMAALSRLTGEFVFEEKAQKAMDVLWRLRHRGTDLMGSVLNVHSGDWVRRDSGVGAGIDSYYEYCLKAYILLGDEKYLGRFNKHYQAIMKYVSQGPMLLDVHMHRPHTNSKHFMDALLAFWPGLQVLKGDIKPAVETHEMLYQVMQRHNFIPEAFTTDFQVHWGHHPLRPEFLESTYFLYRATGDQYYLGVGRKVLKSLQTYARVPCGYAAVSDVRTNKHDDTMDSFVLSETFKYLFLLFAEPNDLVLDLDEFIFTTEGHLLPLTLASLRTNVSSDLEKDVVYVDEFDRACPNSLHLFPASVRQPLRNMVEDVCPRRTMKRRLSASEFRANNLEHLTILSDMGITILTLSDGRIQLLHTFSNAKTPQDAEEGLLFMQEMVELSKSQSQQSKTRPRTVTFIKPGSQPPEEIKLLAGPAHFGPDLRGPDAKVTGNVVFAIPLTSCSDLLNPSEVVGKIAIVERGSCTFADKARIIQKAGAIAGMVFDNVATSSVAKSVMLTMSGDGKEIDDVTIPLIFLFNAEAQVLLLAIVQNGGDLTVTIGDYISLDGVPIKPLDTSSLLTRIKGSFKDFIAQHMVPQNRDSSDVLSKQKAPDEKSIEELATSDTQDGKEFTIRYAHLQAVFSPSVPDGFAHISVTSLKSVETVEARQLPLAFDKYVQDPRYMMVDTIYSSSLKHSTFKMMIISCETKFLLMKNQQKNRTESYTDTEGKPDSDIFSIISWCLKDLSQILPHPWIVTPEKISAFRRREALKQHLLTKLDSADFLKLLIVKLLQEMPHSMPMHQLLSHLIIDDLRFINYAFLRRKLLQVAVAGKDEVIKQRISVMDDIRTLIQTTNPEILIDYGQTWYARDVLVGAFTGKSTLGTVFKTEDYFNKKINNNIAIPDEIVLGFNKFWYFIFEQITKAANKFQAANKKTYSEGEWEGITMDYNENYRNNKNRWSNNDFISIDEGNIHKLPPLEYHYYEMTKKFTLPETEDKINRQEEQINSDELNAFVESGYSSSISDNEERVLEDTENKIKHIKNSETNQFDLQGLDPINVIDPIQSVEDSKSSLTNLKEEKVVEALSKLEQNESFVSDEQSLMEKDTKPQSKDEL
ncbi:ER degradation-enhancing alpha-mannosidase-like protein 3 [Orussus abietinus]|uniref:ER degradation-enhancing alpha-mannosidase-like protein 3 n=1 Tax=Orussus abietinus TaxID=222816 RepID=UPI000626D451|nr:ER degradation-enhancing alpha-mannosidase-like protein 3 [Orussus abietinus]